MAVDPDSGLLILLGSDAQILRFDKAGHLTAKWGRRGGGPGEFRYPSQLGWHGDTLWVFDGALARISLFSSSGKFFRSIPLAVSGTGYLLERGTVAVVPPLIYGVGRQKGPPITIRRYTQQADFLDTILDVAPTYRVLEYSRDGRTVVGEQPFEDGLIVASAASGSGFALIQRSVSNSRHEFTVTRIMASGAVRYQNAYVYNPMPLTSAIFDGIIARLVEQGPPSADPGLPSRIGDALFRPAHLPTVTSAMIGDDGCLWLRRELSLSERTRWTVLDPSGRLLFDTELPTRFWPHIATRTSIWGIERNQDDVPSVSRYRLVNKGSQK